MTDPATPAAAPAIFDLTDFDARDEITYAIKNPKTDEPTSWIWTFFGPGHPVTVELSNRISRDVLRERRAKEQAAVNGKKWKPDEQTPNEFRSEIVDGIVTRVKEFTPVRLNGEDIAFSKDAARKLLLDPKKSWLFGQISSVLRDDENFMQPSPKG